MNEKSKIENTQKLIIELEKDIHFFLFWGEFFLIYTSNTDQLTSQTSFNIKQQFADPYLKIAIIKKTAPKVPVFNSQRQNS